MICKYILLHGIGNQDANNDWFVEALTYVPPTFYSKIIPLYWEDLREPPLEKTLQDARLFHGLKTFTALSSLVDLLTYHGCREKVFARLDDTLLTTDATEIVIIAHSLGSVVAYDYIQNYLKENNTNDGHIIKAKIKSLITLGSPIGRRPVSSKVRPKPLALPWLNVSGTLDLVTSWLGSGKISEATQNIVYCGQTHDLKQYLRRLFYDATALAFISKTIDSNLK
jgi:pimeloyl-ACP methyl ester carboxylesterase